MYSDKKYKYEVYLTYDQNEGGGEALSDEQWSDRADGWKTFDPKHLYAKVNKDKPYWVETIYPDFDPIDYIGKSVYVIVVRYSTGDTFGHSTGEWFVEGVYNDVDETKKVSDSINKGTYGSGKYQPWQGYFERLQDVEVHKFTLKKLLDDFEGSSDLSFYDHSW